MARSWGAIDAERVVTVSDHACCGYTSAADRGRLAASWLADGLRIGQRGLYVAEGSPDDLVNDLHELSGLHDALDSGALAVVPVPVIYDLSVPIDPPSQLAGYDDAVQQAISAGFRGLRVVADITALVADPGRRTSHLRWEQIAERYIVDHPLAPLCLYDVNRISGIEAIAAAHPLRRQDDVMFGLVAAGPTDAALYGEVDACFADVFEALVEGLPDTDENVDVSSLAFVDARSASILHAELTKRRAAGQEVRLVGASPMLQRIWQLCAFDPSLLRFA
jgi:anti-anti-sigma regulatory factor